MMGLRRRDWQHSNSRNLCPVWDPVEEEEEEEEEEEGRDGRMMGLRRDRQHSNCSNLCQYKRLMGG